MKLFSAIYARAMRWSRHRWYAPSYLGAVSFTESSFFPIPPDVMLAPMNLANPSRAWWFALQTTLASVAGGLFGYAINRLRWAACASVRIGNVVFFALFLFLRLPLAIGKETAS